MVIVEQPLIVQ